MIESEVTDQVQSDRVVESITSYSQRAKLREQQKDLKGQNIYGGERCQCHCGNVHWRPIAEVEESNGG